MMRLLTEYLEHALTFERMASEEENAELRRSFEAQAVAYRKLASERAARYGLPQPSPPPRRPQQPYAQTAFDFRSEKQSA
jgi:hypothetical protein